MSAGKPTLALEYNELLVGEYKVYLDQDLRSNEDEVTIDLVAGLYYQKLRVSGIQTCG